MTIKSEGSPLSGAVESRHNLVCGRSKDRNHDAVMRIGSEAPKRRTHSSNRHESQGTCRESATSNRHRYPITSVRTGPKLSDLYQLHLCRLGRSLDCAHPWGCSRIFWIENHKHLGEIGGDLS